MLFQWLFMLMLVLFVSGMKFMVELNLDERTCFYEMLSGQQKYSMDVFPYTTQRYQVQVSYHTQDAWYTIFYKNTQSISQPVNVHKLAPISSTYAFCVKNIDQGVLKLQLKIQSGIQLMEFQLLPDRTDADNLNRQIEWIENQKNVLYESLSRMEGLRMTTDGITNIMSTKLVGFAVLGLISILVVNFIFYRQLKKTFKERKLI